MGKTSKTESKACKPIDTKIKSDLDSLFKSKKGVKKASVVEKEKKDKEQKEADEMKAQVAAEILKRKAEKKDPKRKYTIEGYPIFTQAELKFHEKDNNTPECPFDC